MESLTRQLEENIRREEAWRQDLRRFEQELFQEAVQYLKTLLQSRGYATDDLSFEPDWLCPEAEEGELRATIKIFPKGFRPSPQYNPPEFYYYGPSVGGRHTKQLERLIESLTDPHRWRRVEIVRAVGATDSERSVEERIAESLEQIAAILQRYLK